MMKKQKKSPIAALLLAVLLLLPAGCGVQGGAADTPPGSAQQTEGKDQYQTDPVPDGKPAPVEPEAPSDSGSDWWGSLWGGDSSSSSGSSSSTETGESASSSEGSGLADWWASLLG